MTKAKPKFGLLKEAYAIIGGIPEEQIYLDEIVHKAGNMTTKCGTIACAAGWLGLHPKFQALGLRTAPEGYLLYKNLQRWQWDQALGEIFNIDTAEASTLFGSSFCDDSHPGLTRSEFARMSHKERWMWRVREFLSKHGQLKEQLKADRAQKKFLAEAESAAAELIADIAK